jgi:DNA-binding SARP family transcriptional activator
VASRGDSLFLDPARVSSDFQDFEDAWGSGRLAEAVALYRGPLLDGFHVSGAPEFERWVEAERSRILSHCIEALKRLAKKAENKGHWNESAEWWRKAVMLDRYNSRLMVRRMVALTRGGDRGNAVREGEAHCELLRSDLDLEPDESFFEELHRIRSGKGGPVQFFTPGTVVSGSEGGTNPDPVE